MVKSADTAATNYRTALSNIGAPDSYYNCGGKVDTGGVKAVAECMRGLKKKKATLDTWVSKYKQAYTPTPL